MSIAAKVRSFLWSFQPHKRQEAIRRRRISSIENLGYQILRRGELNSGKKLMAGYTLISPTGEILDNHGMGYTSSYEALKAAKVHSARPHPDPTTP